MPDPTPESRAAALDLFAGEVPCIMSIADIGCARQAEWVVFFEHEEPARSCDHEECAPVCAVHLRLLQHCSVPFWRTWFRLSPWPCTNCGGPLRIARTEAIT